MLINERKTLLKHKIIVSEYKGKVSDFMDELIDIHNFCIKSEDDADTHRVASSVKNMFQELTDIFGNL